MDFVHPLSSAMADKALELLSGDNLEHYSWGIFKILICFARKIHDFLSDCGDFFNAHSDRKVVSLPAGYDQFEWGKFKKMQTWFSWGISFIDWNFCSRLSFDRTLLSSLLYNYLGQWTKYIRVLAFEIHIPKFDLIEIFEIFKLQ